MYIHLILTSRSVPGLIFRVSLRIEPLRNKGRLGHVLDHDQGGTDARTVRLRFPVRQAHRVDESQTLRYGFHVG